MFGFFKGSSSVDDTIKSLQAISSHSIQNRIDGSEEYFSDEINSPSHHATTTINNYYGCCKKSGRKTEAEEIIDVSHLSDAERKEIYNIEPSPNATRVGYHYIDGVRYDFGDEYSPIDEMTAEDWEKYGSVDAYLSQTVKKEVFHKDLELLAKYGDYNNYIKGISIENANKTGFFGKLFGKATKRQRAASVAKKAQQILNERKNEELLKATEKFKTNIDDALKRTKKAQEAKSVADGMRAYNKRRERNDLGDILQELRNISSKLDNHTATTQYIDNSIRIDDSGIKELIRGFSNRFDRDNNDVIDTYLLDDNFKAPQDVELKSLQFAR